MFVCLFRFVLFSGPHLFLAFVRSSGFWWASPRTVYRKLYKAVHFRCILRESLANHMFLGAAGTVDCLIGFMRPQFGVFRQGHAHGERGRRRRPVSIRFRDSNTIRSAKLLAFEKRNVFSDSGRN